MVNPNLLLEGSDDLDPWIDSIALFIELLKFFNLLLGLEVSILCSSWLLRDDLCFVVFELNLNVVTKLGQFGYFLLLFLFFLLIPFIFNGINEQKVLWIDKVKLLRIL